MEFSTSQFYFVDLIFYKSILNLFKHPFYLFQTLLFTPENTSFTYFKIIDFGRFSPFLFVEGDLSFGLIWMRVMCKKCVKRVKCVKCNKWELKKKENDWKRSKRVKGIKTNWIIEKHFCVFRSSSCRWRCCHLLFVTRGRPPTHWQIYIFAEIYRNGKLTKWNFKFNLLDFPATDDKFTWIIQTDTHTPPHTSSFYFTTNDTC